MIRLGSAFSGAASPSSVRIVVAALLAASPTSLPGQSLLEVVPERTILAVATLRAGPAARLAHDHIVVAEDYRARLSFDPGSPQATRFEVEVPTAGLRIDRPGDLDRVGRRLVELGILERPPSPVPEGDRRRIRQEMLGEGQLDAETHPWVQVRLTSLAPREGSRGGEPFPWQGEVEMTVRERSVRIPVLLGHSWEAGRLTVEGRGTARFTAFGIRPYSAFLGAVRVADEFHLYLRLEALAVGGEGR